MTVEPETEEEEEVGEVAAAAGVDVMGISGQDLRSRDEGGVCEKETGLRGGGRDVWRVSRTRRLEGDMEAAKVWASGAQSDCGGGCESGKTGRGTCDAYRSRRIGEWPW